MSPIPDAWGTPLFALLASAAQQAEARHGAYERGGRQADLVEAIAGFTAVLEVAQNVDIRSAAANGLGTALWSRYERFGAVDDLDRAAGLFRDALAMYPDEETPATPSFHANLSNVLRLRWRRTGNEADLAESIDESRAAVAATPASDPRRSTRLNNLADALLAVGLRHDDSSALAEAADRFREALAAARPGEDTAGLRSNLAEALRLRYQATGNRDRALLAAAVEQARAALAEAVPGHPLRPRFQSNLALVLMVRHRPGDVAEAATLARSAVAATPPDHPNRAERLLILAGIQRFTGETNRRTVELARDAADAVPEGHHLRADALLNLGSALAFDAASGDAKAFAPAIAAFRQVALEPTAPVRARVSAAWQGANLALLRGTGDDPARAREAFDLAVSLLPRTAPRRVPYADRERQLAAFAGLARDAAACALGMGDAEGALQLLEHGRGVLLSHALDARTELTGLREVEPGLADRFEALRTALDRPESARFSSGADGAALRGEDRHALATGWDDLLGEIRARPGFAGFLRPPPVDDLIGATAGHGPIVVLNASGLRCDALLLADGRLTVLPLAVNLAEVAARAARLRAAVTRADARGEAAEILHWLWLTVAAPVLEALDLPADARLWWVPTGPFTMLPMHAAGPPTGPGVLDRVVSSYAPTVRSLVTAWQARPAAHTGSPLVIALPSTPGVPDLPSVHAETAMLTGRYPGRTLITGGQAVRQAVLDALPRHPRVHFACHAVSAADGTADGHLVLHDHATAPLTVADIARLRLAHADVAYLSACDTGVSRENLGDEAIHIAGACHMAGFRHVVGTLWAIQDAYAPGVAADFYAGLDATHDAATALHNAVGRLRVQHPAVPALWAPYLHVGP